MKAIVLAAGVGKRLGQFTDRHPKSLLQFGDETLLQRHLRYLISFGIEEITVVAGHLAGQIQSAVAKSGYAEAVRIVLNPLYPRGSALSVLAASDVLASSSFVLMDADLLYEPEVLARLIRADVPSGLLVDERLEDSGEEVKVVVRADGRVWEISKRVKQEGRIAGESVGIYKFDKTVGQRFVSLLSIMTKADPDVEYEEVINALVKDCEVRPIEVDELAWIEIDFPVDVVRARTEIYPRIAGRPTPT